MSATKFEIDGHEFSIPYLDIEKNLRLIALVAPVLSLLAAANGREAGSAGESPEHIVGALSSLPEIFRMFSQHADAKVKAKGTSVEMPLKAMAKDLFTGHSALLVGFILRCVKAELGDFLHADGLKNVMASMAND